MTLSKDLLTVEHLNKQGLQLKVMSNLEYALMLPSRPFEPVLAPRSGRF